MAALKAQFFVNLGIFIFSSILTFNVFGAEEFKNVLPGSTVGTGSHSLRVKILDPVTQQPWINKPYRIIVYETSAKAIAVVLGNTDKQGYTATLKTELPVTDFIARPRMQSGEFAYISQLKLMQNYDGKSIAHAQYIHFFGDGTVFTGISDERGDTVEIGSNKATQLKTQVRQSNPQKEICDWQATAELLNQTINSTPTQKIALINQVLNQPIRKQNGKEGCFTINEQYGDYLITQLLNAASNGGPDLLNATAPLVVNLKTERLIADNLADDSSTKIIKSPAQLRVKAMLELLEEANALEHISPDFMRQWVDKTTTSFIELGKDSTFDDYGKFLNLAESAVWRKDYAVAEKLVNATKKMSMQSQNSPSPTNMPRQLAVEAMIAKSKGDMARAQTLFEDANNTLAGSSEKDVLSSYRAEFKNAPFGKMRINAAMLKDAKSWCPQASGERKQIFAMFAMDNQNLETVSRTLTLDALLTHGTAKAGKIKLASTCKNAPLNVMLTQKDIAQIRAAIMLGGIMVVGGKRDENFNMPKMQLALQAWLQSVELAPGYYEPNKVTQKLNIGF